jgi:SOS response regulatory protein OraA/RecX
MRLKAYYYAATFLNLPHMAFLREDPIYRKLMDYALRALSMRAHTVHELRNKLKKRPHYTKEYEVTILARLLELKLLDDELYVKRSIEKSKIMSYDGPLKLNSKLRTKGIPSDEFWRIWNEMDVNEREIAEKALKKKEKRFIRAVEKDGKLAKYKLRQKKARYLASRGFSASIVFELVKSHENM